MISNSCALLGALDEENRRSGRVDALPDKRNAALGHLVRRVYILAWQTQMHIHVDVEVPASLPPCLIIYHLTCMPCLLTHLLHCLPTHIASHCLSEADAAEIQSLQRLASFLQLTGRPCTSACTPQVPLPCRIRLCSRRRGLLTVQLSGLLSSDLLAWSPSVACHATMHCAVAHCAEVSDSMAKARDACGGPEAGLAASRRSPPPSKPKDFGESASHEIGLQGALLRGMSVPVFRNPAARSAPAGARGSRCSRTRPCVGGLMIVSIRVTAITQFNKPIIS